MDVQTEVYLEPLALLSGCRMMTKTLVRLLYGVIQASFLNRNSLPENRIHTIGKTRQENGLIHNYDPSIVRSS